MPTNQNMVAIETVTVGAGGATSIDFQNIPQTYTDLVILLSSRQSTSSFQGQRLYFNNTDTNLRNNYLLGTGSGTQASAAATGYFGSIAGTNVSASIFDNTFIYISNYTSTSLVKTFSAENIAPANANLAYLGITNGTWNSTSAITRVTLFPDGGGSYTQYSSATLYGVTSAGYGAKATGGIITSDANYYYHTFLASGTFTPTQSITADCLVIAGGGAGGHSYAAGGGAGGLLGYTSQSLSATGYTVTVGAGAAGTATAGSGADGSNSQFGSLTASVGGGGGGGNLNGNGRTGGSGGGGARDTGTGGAATSGQGYAGTNASSGNYAGGGGGAGGTSASGVGGVGSSAFSSYGSATGAGQNVSGTYYFAGGGAGYPATGAETAGGSGGGGRTGPGGVINATANTGGGGGAWNGSAATSGNGGSGIVIVRYAK